MESGIGLYTSYITFLPVNCQVSVTALSQGAVGSPLSPLFFFVPCVSVVVGGGGVCVVC